MTRTSLILGSESPRRRELLALLGLPFTVRPAEVDEEVVTTPEPAANVRARAALKGRALAEELRAEGWTAAVVLAADTTVADGPLMLNKPAGPEEAAAMLRRLRGRAHQVHTGVVVLRLAGGELTPFADVCTTDVWMRPYGEEEIAAYVASGDPLDKAGAYAIQHPVFRPVARISGCYTSVVGLPLCRTAALLRAAGLAPDPAAIADPPAAWSTCDLCTRLQAS